MKYMIVMGALLAGSVVHAGQEPNLPLAARGDMSVPALPETIVIGKIRSDYDQLVHQLLANRMTMYWSASNTYSYELGGMMAAFYKPAYGLSIKPAQGMLAGTECRYDSQGQIQNKAIAEPCAKLMSSLTQILAQ